MASKELKKKLEMQGAMQGPIKAAVFLMSLPEARAVKILKEMEEPELREIQKAVAELGPIDADQIKIVYAEFAEALKAGASALTPGSGYLQELVRKARGDAEAVRLFASPEVLAKQEQTQALAVLNGADPVVLGATLSTEHPQVVAAVLAHLSPELAAASLGQMQMEMQTDVMRRIATLTQVPPQAFADAEQALGSIGLAAAPTGELDGISVAATILKSMAVTTVEELLERMAEQYPEHATDVRRALFIFEDLMSADKRGMQNLMREVQSDTLLVALKTASEELKEKIFSCMSSRAAEMLKEELELMPPTALADVEAAQQQIVELAMRLIGEGKLTVEGRGEGMV